MGLKSEVYTMIRMGKKNVRILSLLLSLVMVISLFTGVATMQVKAATTASGTCGAEGNEDNVTWSYEASNSNRVRKLTQKDVDKIISVTEGESIITASDRTVTVPYTYTDNNAQNPVNQISFMITDKEYTGDDTNETKILYYGALKYIRDAYGNASTAKDAKTGIGVFTLPENLPDGYKVYLLAESVTEGNYTDYASLPVEIEVPKVPVARSINLNTSYMALTSGTWDAVNDHKVYFGQYDSTDDNTENLTPTVFRVLKVSNGKMFLDCDTILGKKCFIFGLNP